MKNLLLTSAIVASAAGILGAQSLSQADLLKPKPDSWPTYNGDYSGRRFSPLTDINSSNVNTLALAWATRFTASGGGGGRGGAGAAAAPAGNTNVTIKATPLMVNGILYFSSPNHVWAADARTGRELWHYNYPANTGSTIGNRGVAIYGNWLFFESPDSNLVSLDARTGKERWKVSIADPKLDYTSTVAPVVIGNHVIAGIGGDHMDNPGFVQSRDPETGALQWKWWTTPRKGDPGMDTWPDEYASAHGTGQAWMPGTYDPELNLYIVGTGNPNPVLAQQSRKGDNLYTCSIVAINPDTGKMVWYFQASPHDVHDWDAVETPVIFDGTIDGKPRKLVAQASRNGYFFVLDRETGKRIVGSPLIDTLNWSTGFDAKGQPIGNPKKYPTTDGVLVSPAENGATNWQAPSFSPQTGLFYVGTQRTWAMYYLIDVDDHPEGWGGLDTAVGTEGAALEALDYKTGKVVWKHEWPSGGGIVNNLSTAGKLLFTSNGQNLIAFDSANGKILWHTTLMAAPTAGPITYMLDGKQYVTVAAGDSLYAFTVNKPLE
jgi:alcohol dehydrogenase (cytochrome c)